MFGLKIIKVSQFSLRHFRVKINQFIDPIFISILADILKNLSASKNAGIYQAVVKQSLPTLASAIGSAKKEESWIASSGIELASSLVSGAPESGLGDGFFQMLGPNLFNCLSQAEDRDVLQVNKMSLLGNSSANDFCRTEYRV